MSDSSLPDRACLPASLCESDQWVCWREQDRDGTPTKVPIDPTTGQYASTTDPETWTSFGAARAYAQEADAAGIGFVFTADDPFVGVDLDDCRVPETGTVSKWATDIIDRLDSYTERSPSGTGFHVIVAGTLPDGRNRKGDVELYDRARFFTMTGDHLADTPTDVRERSRDLAAVHETYVATEPSDSDSEPNDASATAAPAGADLSDEELVDRARTAANGEKFTRLWRGDTSGYDSHSEADMALCSLLAFWAGGDEGRVDRLFRQSGLSREKWDEVHYSDGRTYGEVTVARAVASTDEVYDPAGNDTDATPSVDAVAAKQPSETELDRLRQREAERLERVETLQARLDDLQSENERLRDELVAERTQRRELEVTLADTEAASVWSRLKNVLGWNENTTSDSSRRRE